MLTYGQAIAIFLYGAMNLLLGIYVTVNSKCVTITPKAQQEGGKSDNGSN